MGTVTARRGRRRSWLAYCFLALIVFVSLSFLATKLSCDDDVELCQWFPRLLVPLRADLHHEVGGQPIVHGGFLIHTSGCKIPDFDPLDAAVMKYVKFYAQGVGPKAGGKDSEKIRPDCSGKFGPALVESNLTSLYLVPSAFSHYNVTNISDVNCCYRPFYRVMANRSKPHCDFLFKYGEDCAPFGEDGTAMLSGEEFVRVECRNESVYDEKAPMFYKDFHFFTPLKLALERSREQRRAMHSTEMNQPEDKDKWNVLILGIDSVSRLNFHRQMPKTKEALESLGAVEFVGYNKVADNTFPNVVASMAGLTEEELKSLCWSKSKIILDDCPWIWKNFTAAGYLTAYAEDASNMGIFTLGRKCFLRQPMHYYLTPFSNVAEKENAHMRRKDIKVCLGPRLTVETIFGYTEKFTKTLMLESNSSPFFGLFWSTSLSHDFLNSPGYLDDPFSAFIGRIEAKGVLKNTWHLAVVVISDHGIRFGGIRSTYQGRIEERLPLAYVMLPQVMRDKYPSAVANFLRNARKRLTTPFDIHATLLDILNSETTMTQEAVSRRSKELPSSPPKGNDTSELPRSVSLFLPIPEWRTCKIAWISPHWCCCHAEEKTIALADPVVTEAAGVLIEKVNELLEVYPQCVKRNLTSIKSAVMTSPPDELLPGKDEQVPQYMLLIVESNPGSALFEATVHLAPTSQGRGNKTFDMQVVGTISRINTYGKQSACVDDSGAKLYCYCESLT